MAVRVKEEARRALAPRPGLAEHLAEMDMGRAGDLYIRKRSTGKLYRVVAWDPATRRTRLENPDKAEFETAVTEQVERDYEAFWR